VTWKRFVQKIVVSIIPGTGGRRRGRCSMAEAHAAMECYFDEFGYFCIEVYQDDHWQSPMRVPREAMDGFSFYAFGKTFTISSTPESFSVMPTQIQLPSEAYD
jgi:hypothetical protein